MNFTKSTKVVFVDFLTKSVFYENEVSNLNIQINYLLLLITPIYFETFVE